MELFLPGIEWSNLILWSTLFQKLFENQKEVLRSSKFKATSTRSLSHPRGFPINYNRWIVLISPFLRDYLLENYILVVPLSNEIPSTETQKTNNYFYSSNSDHILPSDFLLSTVSSHRHPTSLIIPRSTKGWMWSAVPWLPNNILNWLRSALQFRCDGKRESVVCGSIPDQWKGVHSGDSGGALAIQ